MGFVSGATNTVQGTFATITSPVQTVKGIWTTITNPRQTVSAIKEGISSTAENLVSGSGLERGEAIFEVASLAVSYTKASKLSLVEDALNPLGAKRPYLRKKTIKEAFKNSKTPDGTVRDPLTDEIINFDDKITVTTKSGRTYQQRGWDMGHKPGMEYKKDYQRYENGEITWDELKELYNDSSRYRPESRSTNRGHSLEEN